jgi:hypothetical protein
MYELYEARVFLKDDGTITRNFESAALALPWIANLIVKLASIDITVTGYSVMLDTPECY